MVQRTNAGGISQMGRATQGVRVMNMKEDDRVSAVALVVESAASIADDATAAEEAGNGVVKTGAQAGSSHAASE
jgi:DNA gyrase subunit A